MPPDPQPGTVRVWVMAVRPRTLGASLIPVAVGSAVAQKMGVFDLGIALLCASAALLLQISANLINDAADFSRGIDTNARRGPRRVTQSGLLDASLVWIAAAVATALACVLGAVLVWSGGWPILLIGLAAIAATIAYSAGPFPLASHGLGEFSAFLFFGLIAVCGTYYLHAGSLASLAVLGSLPVGALVTNLMVVNNLRDIDSDSASGKRTLAVRIGPSTTRRLYFFLLGIAYAAPGFLIGTVGWMGLLPWVTLPLAFRLTRQVVHAHSSGNFNRLLADTARLHLLFGALLALGLIA